MSDLNLSKLKLTFDFFKIVSLWACTIIGTGKLTLIGYDFTQSVNKNIENVKVLRDSHDSLISRVQVLESKSRIFEEWKKRSDPYISNFKKYAQKD